MKKSHTTIIAIDGPDGAGKSTLASVLSNRLGRCPVVCMDDFCYPPSGREGEWWGKDVPSYGVDVQRCLKQVLVPASQALPFRYQQLDWHDFSLKWSEAVHPPIRFLVIEGLHALRQELRHFYKLKVWLEGPREFQLERIAMRDGQHMVSHWTNEFLPIAQLYQEDHDPRASADVLMSLGEGLEQILRRLD